MKYNRPIKMSGRGYICPRNGLEQVYSVCLHTVSPHNSSTITVGIYDIYEHLHTH